MLLQALPTESCRLGCALLAGEGGTGDFEQHLYYGFACRILLQHVAKCHAGAARSLEQCLRQYRRPGTPAALRRTAAQCSLQVAARDASADALVSAAVQLVAEERSPHVRCAASSAASGGGRGTLIRLVCLCVPWHLELEGFLVSCSAAAVVPALCCAHPWTQGNSPIHDSHSVALQCSFQNWLIATVLLKRRLSIMEELLRLLPGAHASGVAGAGAGGARGNHKRGGGAAALGTLRALHALLNAHGAPALRHAAFMALMRAGGQAPTLFREEEDAEPAGGAGTYNLYSPYVSPPIICAKRVSSSCL